MTTFTIHTAAGELTNFATYEAARTYQREHGLTGSSIERVTPCQCVGRRSADAGHNVQCDSYVSPLPVRGAGRSSAGL